MRRILQVGFLIFSFCTAGCAHIPFFGKTTPPDGVTTASEQENPPIVKETYVQSGKIVDVGSLKLGSKFVVVPFKAGVDVAADERLTASALGAVGVLAVRHRLRYNRRIGAKRALCLNTCYAAGSTIVVNDWPYDLN